MTVLFPFSGSWDVVEHVALRPVDLTKPRASPASASSLSHGEMQKFLAALRENRLELKELDAFLSGTLLFVH